MKAALASAPRSQGSDVSLIKEAATRFAVSSANSGEFELKTSSTAIELGHLEPTLPTSCIRIVIRRSWAPLDRRVAPVCVSHTRFETVTLLVI